MIATSRVKRARRPQALPEILSGGLVFIVGALIWRTDFSPQPDANPELPPAMPSSVDASVGWRTASKAHASAALHVVMDQLEAFRHNNYRKALDDQTMFPHLTDDGVQRFQRNFVTGYPDFATARSATVTGAHEMISGPQVAIDLIVTGLSGHASTATYFLENHGHGFKITEVAAGPAPQYQVEGAKVRGREIPVT